MKIKIKLEGKEVAKIVEKHILEEFPQILGVDFNPPIRDIHVTESYGTFEVEITDKIQEEVKEEQDE